MDTSRSASRNGCYDLCHPGHLATLQAAHDSATCCSWASTPIAAYAFLKGPRRPIIDQNDRAAMLAALECVDYVIVFDQSTPHELLRRLNPDVLAKGGTYKAEDVVGREIVEAYGGQVIVTNHVAGVSTTDLLKTIAAGNGRLSDLAGTISRKVPDSDQNNPPCVHT